MAMSSTHASAETVRLNTTPLRGFIMRAITGRHRSSWRRMAVGLAGIGLIVAGCAGGEEPAAPQVGVEEPAVEAPSAEEPSQGGGTPAESSGEAPRVDIPLFPGAELVHEQVLAAAVEEVWVVDAPLKDVIDFYAALPGLAELPGSSITQDDGGGYIELEIFDLVRAGERDPALYEAAVARAEYGPLLRMAVVTPESQMLAWFGGAAAQAAIPPGSTVIVFGVLTG